MDGLERVRTCLGDGVLTVVDVMERTLLSTQSQVPLE